MARTALSRVVAAGSGLLLVPSLWAVTASPAAAAPAGQIVAWGAGTAGQLGDGVSADSTAAVSVLTTGVLAGKTVVQVDAGDTHACAVTADGLLACWGANDHGQLGIGPSGNKSTPQAVTGGVLAGKSVVQVSAGARHTCALTKDGLLACWGEGATGGLGNQPSGSSAVPVPVYTAGILAGRTITQVDTGYDFTCAVASGAVACWGSNGSGQLGDASTTARPIPSTTAATGGSALAGKTVTQVTAGIAHACARSSDGSLACWGSNLYMQVTPSAVVKAVSVPTGVGQGALAGRSVTQVSAGSLFTCAVASGSVVCWGINKEGEMGNGPGSLTPQGTPRLVTTAAPSALAGKTVSFVSAGFVHACALTVDGTIACWGFGGSGQLGTATSAPAYSLPVPFSVTGNPGSGVMQGAVARGVSAGLQFTVGLVSSLADSPVGVSATAGDAQATVAWTSPASTGGSPVTSFVVQNSTDAGATWSSAAGSPVAANVTSLVVRKLANGVNVTFRVAAVTAAGQGAFSSPTAAVIPTAAVTPTPAPTSSTATSPSSPAVVKPGAVQSLSGRSARHGVVVLAWRAPALGTAPTSYQVRRKQSAHRYSAWTTTTATSLTLRRLAKGKSYSFSVRAVNPAGFGPGTVVKVTVR